MGHQHLRYAAGSALLAGLFFTAGLQAQTIVSFDAPGADSTSGSYNGTFAAGINESGMVTGEYADANDVYHGFVRSRDGKYIIFQAPGADTTSGSFNGTFPESINDRGLVTGYFADANSFAHGFLRTAEGKFVTFDAPGAGAYGTFAVGLNFEGDVVGYYTDATTLFHGFLRHADGKFVTFSGPGSCTTGTSTGCYGSAAVSINSYGLVAGHYMDNSGNFVEHTFIRLPEGGLVKVAVPGAGTGLNQGTGCPGCALGLNKFGFVAGIWTDPQNVYHGFFRDPWGKYTTFDAPGAGTGPQQGTGCFSDCIVSVNNFGVITGNYIDAANNYHIFVRSTHGKMTTFDPQGSTESFLAGLNDSGLIVGYYLDANNVYHSFLRYP